MSESETRRGRGRARTRQRQPPPPGSGGGVVPPPPGLGAAGGPRTAHAQPPPPPGFSGSASSASLPYEDSSFGRDSSSRGSPVSFGPHSTSLSDSFSSLSLGEGGRGGGGRGAQRGGSTGAVSAAPPLMVMGAVVPAVSGAASKGFGASPFGFRSEAGSGAASPGADPHPVAPPPAQGFFAG